MESTNETSRPAILEKAWMHHAELDTNADRLNKRHLKLRKWVISLGIVATFLAIITDIISSQCPQGINADTCQGVRAVLRILLILTPLVGSMIAAFTSRELGDGRWLSMRAGAEEIKKEIYIYRTVLSHHPQRNKWLSNRLAYIQRQVFKASGRRLDTEPYKGVLPLYYSPDDPKSDPGFNDLTAEEYISYRLQEQLSWHEGRIVRLSKAKRNLTIAILLAGVAGALLAALGGSFSVWVALTASFTAALTGWEELRNRDKTILNYSKVKLELSIVRDYWYSLSPEEQTDSEFYKMVLAAENVMFAQNGEWLRSMQEALAGAEDEDKKLVEEMVELSATSHAELQRKLLSESQVVFAQATEQLSAVAADAAATVSGMVTAVSGEAMALNQTMAASVDAATAEAAAARLALESSRDVALQEASAWRETAQDSATIMAAQSAAARQSVAETVDATALEAEAARVASKAQRAASASTAVAATASAPLSLAAAGSGAMLAAPASAVSRHGDDACKS
ncbi:MAG: SLATT domain-containing protein, partial [Chloroflexi bacterium]|nr:SLATT domain-containing protein [Chloroflexota bacterium]NOG33834.1 SLATT domain-containing protein [Chloroflexota bacterium]